MLSLAELIEQRCSTSCRQALCRALLKAGRGSCSATASAQVPKLNGRGGLGPPIRHLPHSRVGPSKAGKQALNRFALPAPSRAAILHDSPARARQSSRVQDHELGQVGPHGRMSEAHVGLNQVGVHLIQQGLYGSLVPVNLCPVSAGRRETWAYELERAQQQPWAQPAEARSVRQVTCFGTHNACKASMFFKPLGSLCGIQGSLEP